MAKGRSHASLVALVLVSCACGILWSQEKKPLAVPPADDVQQQAESRKAMGLERVPYKIVYETWQESNWELFLTHADGSNPVNLTRTPEANELYPHVSPDATKVCFSCDVFEKAKPVRRDVYWMNLDGSGRTLVARNARQACWGPDSATIAYLGAEFEKFTYTDYATRGIFFFDTRTGKTTQHPNKNLHHLYNLCWSPNGKWFVATVHAGMDFKHAILAIQADGQGVYNLNIPGCRPDISPDGKRIAWGSSDFDLCVADLHLELPAPKVANTRVVAHSEKPLHNYHADFSPDGRYITFSQGPTQKNLGAAPEIVGIRAKGWNICVADVEKKNCFVRITTDGACNKEPDWMPARK